MSTGLQGINDQLSQIQPTEPNLAFDAQILGATQSKYDQGHAAVNNLYGSLLNSSLTRESNSKARDEFFKLINNDIKRMGGLDFSLKSNQQAAANVFQSIYKNKNIVKDMMWTKKYNEELSRAEAFKDCIDPEKCGGQYWDEGVKFMNYKREEFKNASDSEAMGFGDATFVPYSNVMEKAMTIAKKAGLKIKTDSFDGAFIVTTQNGVQLESPLAELLTQTLGQNPQIQEMYKAKAYVDRKDWIQSKISTGEYADEAQAQVGYFKEKSDASQAQLTEQAEKINVTVGYLQSTYDVLAQKIEDKKMIEGSDEHKKFIEVQQLLQNSQVAKEQMDQYTKAAANINNSMGLRAMGDAIDQQTAGVYFQNDILGAAKTLSMQDAETKYEVNELVKQEREFAHDIRMEQIESSNARRLAQINNAASLERTKINAEAKGQTSTVDQTDVSNYESALADAQAANSGFTSAVDAEYLRLFKPLNGVESERGNSNYKALANKQKTSLNKKKASANELAIKAGKMPPFFENVSADALRNGNQQFIETLISNTPVFTDPNSPDALVMLNQFMNGELKTIPENGKQVPIKNTKHLIDYLSK